mgnify:CR=1 FL=1
MKTIKLKHFAAGLMFLGLLGSCSDDLDRFPHSSIEKSQSFQTIEDAATWNTGMYALLQNRVYGIFMYSTDIQADQLNATVDFGNRNGAIHRWDNFLADDYTIRDTWAAYYSGIANANVAIEGMAGIVTEDAADQAELDRYIAEAHLVRAFYYHQLVTRWAKDYDPSTAASDPGVPLLLEFDIDNFPPRSTVEEVYQQILADIAIAKTGLAGVAGTPGAMYFNEDVVTALEARVKFYMEDWAGAKAAADKLIKSGKYPLYTTVEGLESMWYEDAAQEDILQLFASQPLELANANVVYLGYNAGIDKYSPDFVPTQWMLDLYAEGDHRRDVYFDEKPLYLGGADYPDVTLVNKYPGNPELFTSASTNYQHAPKVFRIAEMYLISAESAAMLNDDSALTTLNALRTARGLEEVSVSGDALLAEIKEERTRELAYEGFRLDDLKRWDEGLHARTPQDDSFLMTGPNFIGLTQPAGANKFVWGIPQNDITINPNLAGNQNPGW